MNTILSCAKVRSDELHLNASNNLKPFFDKYLNLQNITQITLRLCPFIVQL